VADCGTRGDLVVFRSKANSASDVDRARHCRLSHAFGRGRHPSAPDAAQGPRRPAQTEKYSDKPGGFMPKPTPVVSGLVTCTMIVIQAQNNAL